MSEGPSAAPGAVAASAGAAGRSGTPSIHSESSSSSLSHARAGGGAAGGGGGGPFPDIDLLAGEEPRIQIDESQHYVSKVEPLTERVIPGSLLVTNFRLCFASSRHSLEAVDMPLGIVNRLEKFGGANSRGDKYGIEITCKDFFSLRLQLSKSSSATNSRQSIFDQLQKLTFRQTGGPGGGLQCFAMDYWRAMPQLTEQGWDVYNPLVELERLGVRAQGSVWKVCELNKDYGLCPTYPQLFAIPTEITDDDVRRCAAYRSRGRVPVLSWLDRDTRASITRCSQPLVGLSGKRCQEDERFLAKILTNNGQTTSLCIIDARPKTNAVANRGKGGGYEAVSDYNNNVEVAFVDIQNIHVMRESLRKLREICWPALESVKFLSCLDSSQWLGHIRQILVGVVYIVHKVGSEKYSVLVHCSDGWDRTAQLTALSMMCLDPFYRTVRGFEALIEKEWCSMGHQFAKRVGFLEDNPSDSERSPVFLQFIECVWQLTQQFPNAFEFNEHFLLTVLDHLYSNRFGTFLGNCDQERGKIRATTHSLWSLVNSMVLTHTSPFYAPGRYHILKPQHSAQFLRFWAAYYLRHYPHCRQQEPVQQRHLRMLAEERQYVEAQLRSMASATVTPAGAAAGVAAAAPTRSGLSRAGSSSSGSSDVGEARLEQPPQQQKLQTVKL